MDKVSLLAEARTERKKQAAKRVRRAGRLPAVVYGGDGDSIAISLDERSLHTGLISGQGANTIFKLEIDGGQRCDVVVREIHRDPLTGQYIHADLIRVVEGQRMLCRIPLNFIGTPRGVRNEGGVLEKYMPDVELFCSPAEAPASIDVDITSLEIGHALLVEELDVRGLELVTEARYPIATVHPPRVQIEEEEAAEAEEAEEGEEEASDEAAAE